MALTDGENGTGMVMPVGPIGYGGGNYGGGYGGWGMPYAVPVMGGYGGGWGNGFGGDFSWIVILFLFAMMGGGFGNGWGGGFGGWGLGNEITFPWLLNGQQGINANTNAGFNQAATASALGDLSNAVTSGFGDVQLGIAGVNQNICQTGNSIVGAVTGAQNALSQQMYTNQLADLERSFAAQTATTAGMNGIQSQLAQCGCDNRLATESLRATVLSENCADRYEAANNTRDIIDNQSRGIQTIMDKLCALELDSAKREASDLRQQLNMAQLAASQAAQNAFISQGFANEVDALYNRLNSCPVPSTPVFGRTPIFACGSNSVGCGCNGNGFVA